MRSSASSNQRRSSLSEPRRRVLKVVGEIGGPESPVTLADVAQVVGGHPNTSRQHLDALARDGLIEVTTITRPSSGRRPHAFFLTQLGLDELDSPTDDYLDLVRAVASHSAASGHSAERGLELGEVWGNQRATTVAPTSAADDVALEVLDMLGFDPAPAQDGDGLVLHSCPLSDLVQENPEFACALHEGLVRGVLRRACGAEIASLEPHSEPDGCRLRLAED